MPDEGESRNTTRFDPSDAPPDQERHYEALQATNRGYVRGGFADTANQAAEDRQNRLESIASSLELTEVQQDRAERWLQAVDLQRMGLSLDLVIFCVCVLSAREDRREYHPSRSRENNDEVFVEQAEAMELRPDSVASCWEKLRRQFDL